MLQVYPLISMAPIGCVLWFTPYMAIMIMTIINKNNNKTISAPLLVRAPGQSKPPELGSHPASVEHQLTGVDQKIPCCPDREGQLPSVLRQTVADRTARRLKQLKQSVYRSLRCSDAEEKISARRIRRHHQGHPVKIHPQRY